MEKQKECNKIAKDVNGIEIKKGQTVTVCNANVFSGSTYIVHKIFYDRPTRDHPGFWVDISSCCGIEGMMSYVLEIVK